MSMLVLRRLEGQSRLLEEVIVLTVLKLPRRYMLIGRNDGELLESVDWTKRQHLHKNWFRRNSVSKFVPLALELLPCHLWWWLWPINARHFRPFESYSTRILGERLASF